MLLLKRNNVPLDRDVIFLAESGEEADVTGVGINFMVGRHFDEIDAEYAMTEGGGAKIEGDRVTVVNIGTAEKVPARARLVASGTSGHGSVPRLDNAILHLSGALDKLGKWETPCASTTPRGPTSKRWLRSRLRRKRRIIGISSTLGARPQHNAIWRKTTRQIFHAADFRGPTMLKAGVGPM